MDLIHKNDGKTRITICVMLILLSLLIIGAGRMTEELRQREAQQKEAKEKWRTITANMVSELPREHQEDWKKSANRHPKLLLKICTARFRPVSSGGK